MRPYETLIVLRTNLGDDSAKLLTRFETVITGQGGSIDENRDWGVRDLAYPIGKQKQGHYHLLEYQADPTVVKELERNLRIVEGVMRFVTVQQDHTGLPEPRQREHYGDRRDAPLHEMRSMDRDSGSPDAVSDGAERGEEGAEMNAAPEEMQ